MLSTITLSVNDKNHSTTVVKTCSTSASQMEHLVFRINRCIKDINTRVQINICIFVLMNYGRQLIGTARNAEHLELRNKIGKISTGHQ